MTIHKRNFKFKAMEEKKNQAVKPENRKLTYDELSKAASDLHVQYQKLMAEYQKVVAALQNREFDQMSFLLQAQFKVLDNAAMYTPEFVKWCAESIEAALKTFSESMVPAEENKNEA